MTPLVDSGTVEAPAATDLATAIQQVLQSSSEPLTVSKIRIALPPSHRSLSVEELAEALRRQVAANVVVQYPRYRSQQDRFWDRPMEVHIVNLIEAALEEGPLPWSELRRKLPTYAQQQAQTVLEEHVRRGSLHRHPRAGRGAERYGRKPAHPREYLRDELREVFNRLEKLGFQPGQIREAAIELLHEEEWESRPESEKKEQEPSETHAEQQPAHAEASASTAHAPAAHESKPAHESGHSYPTSHARSSEHPPTQEHHSHGH